MISKRTTTEAAFLFLAGALASWACMPGGIDGGPADAQEPSAITWTQREGTCADATVEADDQYNIFTIQDPTSVVHLSALISAQNDGNYNSSTSILMRGGRVYYNTCEVLDGSAYWKVLIGRM